MFYPIGRGLDVAGCVQYIRRKPPYTMTYTEAVAELEQLLAQLREVPSDIDQLHSRVARAEQLLAACRDKLRGAEEGLAELRQRSE